jgi:hypothetical protein
VVSILPGFIIAKYESCARSSEWQKWQWVSRFPRSKLEGLGSQAKHWVKWNYKTFSLQWYFIPLHSFWGFKIFCCRNFQNLGDFYLYRKGRERVSKSVEFISRREYHRYGLVPSLVKIGPKVLKKRSKMLKFTDGQTFWQTDNRWSKKLTWAFSWQAC